jgi:hypothetical protein
MPSFYTDAGRRKILGPALPSEAEIAMADGKTYVVGLSLPDGRSVFLAMCGDDEIGFFVNDEQGTECVWSSALAVMPR